MTRRYEATLFRPCPEFGDFRPCAVRRFSTAERARRQCERWLAKHPTVETRYRSERWTWGADIRDIKTGRTLDVIEAPVEIVPSVGELGYW